MLDLLSSSGRRAVALYPYAACKTDELTFGTGQIVHLITTPDEGWWEGRVDDRFGWFPTPYVQEFEGEEPPPIPSDDGGFGWLRMGLRKDPMLIVFLMAVVAGS